MAVSPAGVLLTQAQQRIQLGIRSLALRDLLMLFPAWRLEQVDGSWDIDAMERTWGPFMVGLLAVLERYHNLSARQAAAYYTTLRTLEGAGGQITPRLAEFDREQATRNLMLLGPIFTKKQIATMRPRVQQTAVSRLAGATTALVMSGHRETVRATQELDSGASGFRRVLSGEACEFCSRLAARGVMATDFQAHSHCACIPEPAFRQS